MKKKVFSTTIVLTLLVGGLSAQKIKASQVPASVKSALQKKYADAKDVDWEKEKGNFEANWGGKSREDNSVVFTPAGELVEVLKAIPVSQLPAPVTTYVKQHYKGAKISEAGRVTDAKGVITYEAEVNKKILIFDEKGNFR